jgi:UDP-glucose:glycoprotein glucosyltransferase
MMRSIARNFFNLVLFVDPARTKESRDLLRTVESFYVNDVPIRIGFVFVTKNQEEVNGFECASTALFRAHNYIKEKTASASKALGFLTEVYAKNKNTNEDIQPELVINEFKKKYPKEKNLDDVFGAESYYDDGRKLSMEYYYKVGLKTLPQVFVNGFPLGESELEADQFEESVITKVMHQTQDIQMAVYRGQLYDGMNLLDWLMNKDNIMPRLSPRILAQDRQYVDLTSPSAQVFAQSNMKYILNDKEAFHPFTLWMICDPDTQKGRQLLNDALYFYDSSKESIRVGLIMLESSTYKSDNDLIKKSIHFALNNLNQKQSFTFIKRLLKEKNYNDLKSKKVQISDIDFKDISNAIDFEKSIEKVADLEANLEKNRAFLASLNLPFKNSGIIANGWVIGPFGEDETFIESDFSLLENFMLRIGLKQVKEMVKNWSNKNSDLDDLDNKVLMINSIIGKYSSNEKRIKLPDFSSGVVKVPPKNPLAPFFDVNLIIDPLTRQAQRISTILRVLSQVTNVNLVIYFNCKEKLSAAPLKSFYRYVLESDIKFHNGKMVKPYAYFSNMPQSPILTMNIHPPESWMVEASNSPYDLDNICLKEIDENADGVFGEFELEHLIIEGHAFDVLSGQSPRGLQFNLGTFAEPFMYDTIVMANLGYFQLKASPGMWLLQLREGRSKDIYEIVSHENTDSESKRSPTVIAVIDSFEAKIIRVKVSKKADKLNENLLDDKDAEKDKNGSGGIWDSINRFDFFPNLNYNHVSNSIIYKKT